MPTPDDTVELLIGGKVHGDWSSYEIDSDLLTPADGWSVSMGMVNGKIPADVAAGAPVKVLVGGEVVMTGYVDDPDHPVSKTGHSFSLSGRDMAADLVDCSAPIFTAKLVSLKQIAAKITSLFGIKAIRIDADATRTREKVSVEPGDTAWDALARAAEANGLWPWFEPDGTLVIGGPDYSTPIVATLILRKSGDGNNLISLNKHESMHGRYSKVTVYGQAAGTETEQGRNALQGSWVDEGVPRYRPKIVIDHDCESVAMCRDRARKIITDSRLSGLTLSALVKGHRIVAPGQPSDGQLWKPMQRVHVISEPHEIDGVFFMMARKFNRNRQDGTRTALTLKEDGMWLINARPHKKAHRRGKNAMPGEIIDVSGAAT
ncbi:phage baseplate assembly protein [Sideroxydans lithotrophicus]|uniref:Mu P family protein n=1 Tax=Sideroxydans lithotrophicus (strain ES-1) TaxID=580332 RepID=D5CUE8_SIDLE|nr:tail protein [Sideroxydans lithotrophicus]ADE10483.1 Mu P family protein [Sideroxydans lithotrophicus ES-1]